MISVRTTVKFEPVTPQSVVWFSVSPQAYFPAGRLPVAARRIWVPLSMNESCTVNAAAPPDWTIPPLR